MTKCKLATSPLNTFHSSLCVKEISWAYNSYYKQMPEYIDESDYDIESNLILNENDKGKASLESKVKLNLNRHIQM